MRIARFSPRGAAARLGLVEDEHVIDLGGLVPATALEGAEWIAAWPRLRPQLPAVRERGRRYPLSDVQLHAPVARPGKILALGLNYADHCAEAGFEIPQRQTWFSKAPSAVNGPFDPIELPWVSEQLDHECELVVVIGQRCRDVPRARAHEVVFGYCAGNDVSVRDWQLASSQWVIGKSFDTHAPIGPWITSADAVNPGVLGIRCLVNAEVRQQSNTRHLVFDVAAQIEHVSKAMTLEPGDLLFTGTCGGVGAAHKPPRWLRAGDRVRVEIDGLGAIENVVQPRSRHTSIGAEPTPSYSS
jgi:2-keto-4-pentenoate hydratase/2-oxohepta-3-ene-1,7-dioic acid hydratase in catechol pathway